MILDPFGLLYGKIADLRNKLYDSEVLRSYSLGAKTISVGNITAGGTGKTPLVAFVAEVLAGRGETVCILTRGYGRSDPHARVLVSDGSRILADAGQAGDEPAELARRLIGKAVIISDADRVSAGKWAKEEFGITAFVMDDGFQHRKVKRDLDIVCIDATDPFGGGKMLPAGRLRETLHNLGRADAIVITRADLIGNTADVRTQIREFTECPIFESHMKLGPVVTLADYFDGSRVNAATPEKLFAFSGVGNPKSFTSQLRTEGLNVIGERAFHDHHRYSQTDIESIETASKGADALITTAKDAEKLSDLPFKMPCYVALSGPEIENADDLVRLF